MKLTKSQLRQLIKEQIHVSRYIPPIGEELGLALYQLVKNHKDELYKLVMAQTDDSTDRPVRYEDIEATANDAAKHARDSLYNGYGIRDLLEDVAIRVLRELMEAE